MLAKLNAVWVSDHANDFWETVKMVSMVGHDAFSPTEVLITLYISIVHGPLFGHRSFRMATFNRDLVKLDGADSPASIVLSSLIVLGSIALLVLWGIRAAYL
jgi:hypothetical protein